MLLPLDEVVAGFGRVSPAVWVGALVAFLGGHAVGAVKWHLLIRAAGSTVRLRNAFRAYGAGLFANLWLPSIVGGDVVRAGWVVRGHGQAEALAVGGVADRLLDAAALATIAAVGFVLVPPIPGSPGQRTLAIAILGLLSIAVLLVAVPRGARARPRSFVFLERLLVALEALASNPRPALVATALSIGVQLGFVLLNAWLGRAMGITVALSAWLLAWPLAKLAATLPIGIGGLGVREAALAGLLAPFGVPPAVAVAQSLLWQTVLLAGGVVAGLVTARIEPSVAREIS